MVKVCSREESGLWDSKGRCGDRAEDVEKWTVLGGRTDGACCEVKFGRCRRASHGGLRGALTMILT
jgi:hypothetical protein